MSRVYCDTNILVPVIILESQSIRIRTWISSPDVTPVVSDLVVLEFSATISRLVRERTLSDSLGHDAVGEFETWRKTLGRPLTITRQTFAIARTIVEDAALGVRGPDALHLALLQVTGLPFATFDARLGRAAATLGLATLEPPPL
ncbi:Predicted nucleic acid-binding protein, contains PIN domain [Methylobacterium sp. 174MFSha1.1]|uniref:type II toxin-antitoxin system VapC family toxin n=1 Tax=Methylobacterium sp. 174MFSha1.1 TaxID=1502749 RepID=UPI0008E83621|nr:type II toxin-antitoxin system VapC family toxin [Methylobacterium sp. 174MFSha1.1]SFV03276.1 Predicted nucleic acid-binding protein, contains PIN domain [Methylobacterium sp. 174MFSha1.1]